ncbi:MAG: dihydroorotase [Clostridium perfringens]|nr:dihydroorotase [Clostridium perfringens]
MNLLIKNANVTDLSHNFYGDLYIENGLIKEIGKDLKKNCETVDAKGLTLMPSFIDTHVHFRDPGFTHKEDIETGSKAAVRGGYTTVVLMPNTKPTCSSLEVFNYVIDKTREVGLIDSYPVITITKDLKGKDLSHLESFFGNEDVKAISDDGRGVNDSKVMLEAMNIAKKNNWIVMSHAESEEFSKIDMRLAENMMTSRDIELAKYTGARLHMAHVSTIEAMKCIIEGKKSGANITCEVTPHHIGLDSTKSNYRVNPPIREKEDVSFLIDAIKLGYVDCIGTDHAPHTDEEKAKGSPGMTGIELAFPICYTTLVKNNGLSLNNLSKVMSYNPGKILGLNKGKLEIGFSGDLVLVDLDKKIKIDREKLVSKSKNTPFHGEEFYGDVVLTIKSGKIVYKGEF